MPTSDLPEGKVRVALGKGIYGHKFFGEALLLGREGISGAQVTSAETYPYAYAKWHVWGWHVLVPDNTYKIHFPVLLSSLEQCQV